ncbi:rod-binding protein [Roseomonas elaeocarpi]|uniref:Rod-binding protein n=1 Tax=Roseomonas elaeocarpi TaxID=907779 RepID=A0ABV6JT69_9PROT
MGSLPASPTAAPVAPATPQLGMAQDPAAMRKAAAKFESQTLSALLQPAFNAAANDKSAFGGGEAEAQWRPMLVDAYAEAWVRRGGIGLSQSVMGEMLRMQSASGGHPSPAPDSASTGHGAGNTSSTPHNGESVP